MIPLEWLHQARGRLAPHLTKTPLTFDQPQNLYLKWDNRQVTGSFKFRGALNKGLSLAGWEIERGMVAASAGNHGQGVASAGRIIGASTLIFASESAVPIKITAMTNLGAEVRLVPGGYAQDEQEAIRYAAQTASTWISSYNDGLVIAGQGTLGLEVLEELATLEQAVWIVPAGGGGLVAGALRLSQYSTPRRVFGGLEKGRPAYGKVVLWPECAAHAPTFRPGPSGTM